MMATWIIRFAALAAAVCLSLPGWARAADPVAVLTELRMERGQVQVKRAGESQWAVPQPLLALRPGDQLRAMGEARAVLVFTGGRGVQSVSASNSPFTVEAPVSGGSSEKLRGVLGSVADFLVGKQKDLNYLPLSVRAARPPRVMPISPRDTKLASGPVVFEWSGSDGLRYRLRVSGPEGVLWQESNLRRQPLTYPASAATLSPGVRYSWEVEGPGQPIQRAEFELLSAAEAARVRETMDLITPAALPGSSRSSVAVMRAGWLFQQQLYADSRRELMTALAADPDEPTLHVLLGQVYERTGLGDMATREFIEARDLSSRKP
jgi:hypothetical protein